MSHAIKYNLITRDMKLTSPLTLTAFVIFLLFTEACSDTSFDANQAPTAMLEATPLITDTLTYVSFDASASYDESDPQSDLKFQWDFLGNKQWSEIITSPTSQYKYNTPGVYSASVKVTDGQGWSGEKCLAITVVDSLR